jgi:tRNA A37 threonylcarbamoyladenosine synthetase subunit TsaC/SUA5/YrdC
MKKINLDDVFDVEKLASELLNSLREGGILCLPLDSGYGLLVNSENLESVEKCRELLRNNQSEALLLKNKEQAQLIFDLTEVTEELVEDYLPGSILVQADGAGLYEGSIIRIRLMDHSFINKLVNDFEGNILVFEPNLNDEPPVYDLSQLAANKEVFDLVDLVLDAGTLDLVPMPTSVRVEDNQLVILREGKLIPRLVVQFSIRELN